MPGRRRVKLGYVLLGLLALYAVLEWGVRSTGLALLVAIPAFFIALILLVRATHRVIRQSIWRLRNRLYVTYVFIGVVPIVLILALIAVGTWILSAQIGVYVVTNELDRRATMLAAPARIIAQAKPTERPAVIERLSAILSDRMPDLKFSVLPRGAWKDYVGYILRDGKYYSAAVADADDASVIAMAPIDAEVLKNSEIGAFRVGGSGPFQGTVPPPASGFENFDFRAEYFGPISEVRWNDPGAQHSDVLWVTTRPSAVLGTLFRNGLDAAQAATVGFLAILFLLLLGELISLVIGISLTRTITSAVHGLYEGTERIGKGDFSWRIPVKGNDQLAELGKSFNQMTTQIENLVVIAKEKERLQSEVLIAGEVQKQLFPRSAPTMRTIEMVGTCKAARMVSGDYYDYVALPDGNLALAVGDVAGKGISAALLMASIQSIMRTQLAAGLSRAATAGGQPSVLHYSTSKIVAQLNRQLYASTAPEKYATFFFGLYDDQSRVLTYTNAGHLQPLLLHKGVPTQLEVTGTVVGAFPMIEYEEQTVAMHAGDLLIAYTDGVTEPENAYGQEFGVERLTETALKYQSCEPTEVVARIMEAVTQWSSAPEQPDDMTLVIARGMA